MAAAPVAGASSQIPGADQYASAEVMANNAYNNALAQLNQNRLNILTQYGYTGNVDPSTGVVTGVRVDPNAQYGELQQLLHGNAIEDRNAVTAAQDRGLFDGGLANQALSEARYAHGAADTQLGTSLESALSGLQEQQQSAAETRDNALWQAEQSALDAELQGEQSQTLEQLLQGGYTGSSGSSSSGSGGGSSAGPGPSGSGGGKPKGGRGGRGGRSNPHRSRAIKRIVGRGGGKGALAL